MIRAARIQEGVVSLGGYADIFLRNTLASGVVPQISCIMGPCAGGAVYSPAITDFNIMVKDTSYMFITGPDVIKTVTHADVTKEELGGALTHNSISGVAHFAADSDEHALRMVRELLSFIPSNKPEDPPRLKPTDSPDRADIKLNTVVPEASNQPYDIREVINAVVDDEYFLKCNNITRQTFASVSRAWTGVRWASLLLTCFSRRRARYRRFSEGGAFCTLLRLLQYSADCF